MSGSTKASLGSAALAFTLPRSGGGSVSLADYRVRLVALAFLRGYA